MPFFSTEQSIFVLARYLVNNKYLPRVSSNCVILNTLFTPEGILVLSACS